MAEILVGLLCRFLGSRFVASSAHGFICTISKNIYHSVVKVEFCFISNQNFVVKVFCGGKDGVILVSKRRFKTPQKNFDHKLTCAVAQLVVPFMCSFVSSCRNDPGICSLSEISDIQLIDCLSAFTNSNITKDGINRVFVGNKAVVFWPKHISFKSTKNEYSVNIPTGIEQKRTDTGRNIFWSSKHSAINIDSFIVLVCQSFVIGR